MNLIKQVGIGLIVLFAFSVACEGTTNRASFSNQISEYTQECVKTDLLTVHASAQPPSNGKPVIVKGKISGCFRPLTDIRDEKELGGYADSRNRSHSICELPFKAAEGIMIAVDTLHYVNLLEDWDQTAPIDSSSLSIGDEPDDKEMKAKTIDPVLGRVAYLVNASDSVLVTEAQDSRIDVVLQAYFNGNWIDIETLPQSWCGNSYHRVFLSPRRYWSFKVPVYSGPVSSLLRYRFAVNSEVTVFSNVFKGKITQEQLVSPLKRNGPRNIMDPYDD
jgi:hypothetical protein